MANNGPVVESGLHIALKTQRSSDHESSNLSRATNPWIKWNVNGPYKHADGRKFVILTACGKRKTTSYARYLMEIKLGRLLTNEEEVDHIDNDQTNDSINNLQILTKTENIKKSPKPKSSYCYKGHLKVNGICKICKSSHFKKWSKKRIRW